MKWIFLSLILTIFSAHAVQQYTESSCILVKQQVIDYKRRLGTNSFLYTKAKSNFDSHCQHPIAVIHKPQVLITNTQAQPVTKVTPTNVTSVLQRKETPNHLNLPIQPNPFTQIGRILMPMFSILFLGLIAIFYFKKKLPVIKGYIGEKYVINGLKRQLDENKYSLINDVTLQLEEGGTTQIDHIVISTFGLFVIETKNLSGWIFGNENQAKWTQTFHRKKYSFQNPLRQNYKHIKTLSYLLDLPIETFYSIVVFSPNAELKTKMPNNVGSLKNMIAYIKSFQNEIIAYEDKLKILASLNASRLEQGKHTNKQHIKYLKEKHRKFG